MSAEKKEIKLITPVFRGSFVHLVTPHKIDKDDPDEEPKYDITIVLEKDDAEAQKFVKRLEAAINTAMIEKNGKAIPKGAMKHYPIKDGDESENEDFAGKWLISARNKFKPDAVDKNGQKLFNEEQLYSGAWYRASISLYAWAHPKFGKGVSINLKAVLKERDDEAFGGGAKAKDEFSEFIDEDGGGSGNDSSDESDDSWMSGGKKKGKK